MCTTLYIYTKYVYARTCMSHAWSHRVYVQHHHQTTCGGDMTMCPMCETMRRWKTAREHTARKCCKICVCAQRRFFCCLSVFSLSDGPKPKPAMNYLLCAFNLASVMDRGKSLCPRLDLDGRCVRERLRWFEVISGRVPMKSVECASFVHNGLTLNCAQ